MPQSNVPKHPFASTLGTFSIGAGKTGLLYSLPDLAKRYPNVSRLPQSLRIVLESVLRHCDGERVMPIHVERLANWQPNAPRNDEIPFTVARVVLQDFTGVPLLADLAAMRSTAVRLGHDPEKIQPMVPVDLVVDHSVTVDHYGSGDALGLNMALEFRRNRERYEFLKWGMQAFDSFKVVPPGFGIVHQVNLEYLARGVHMKGGLYFPDTLVGTDSHTTMINGIGVVAWGVGGIEAEAAMLGQAVSFLTPDVVGFELTGRLREGCTATDLVLTVTEILRRHKVVGKFVEFFGAGTASLPLPDRATIANMAPEYGATMGFFPVDDKTLNYFRGTGRSVAEMEAFESYFRAQGLWGVPGAPGASQAAGEIRYSQVVTLDLGQVTPGLAGPKRPQDRIELGQVAQGFGHLFGAPFAKNGFNRPAALLHTRHQPDLGEEADTPAPDTLTPTPPGAPRFVAEMEDNKPARATAHPDAKPPSQAVQKRLTIGNGDVLIAAITSCTNTSNPSVLLAAGLLAKKAVKAGLTVMPHIKTSLAPGSRIVTEYLTQTGLLPYLEQLGFSLVGYGCTTCIGNSGDLAPEIKAVITQNDLVCAAVLSGNRNFEARIHPNLKANYLASPPLVVAYAIAGTVLRDLMTEPVGHGHGGKPVYLGDIWPSSDDIQALMKNAMRGKAYRDNYGRIGTAPGPLWEAIQGVQGLTYTWPQSTYIAQPPFLDDFALELPPSRSLAVRGARIMALFGDSITTDHISPAGAIAEASPAGRWLLERGVLLADFNSYGARRGQHEVMVRGTFANVRIQNRMLGVGPDGSREEGGWTLYQHTGMGQGQKMSIFDAAARYRAAQVPTVVFAGEEYGTGSSRDWAAKGTQLLGIRAVIARSFERIHRSNLVGMGVLPLQFRAGDSRERLGLTGEEVIDVLPPESLQPQSEATLRITDVRGRRRELGLDLRIDTPMEVKQYLAGGILPHVLRQLLGA